MREDIRKLLNAWKKGHICKHPLHGGYVEILLQHIQKDYDSETMRRSKHKEKRKRDAEQVHSLAKRKRDNETRKTRIESLDYPS